MCWWKSFRQKLWASASSCHDVVIVIIVVVIVVIVVCGREWCCVGKCVANLLQTISTATDHCYQHRILEL